MLVVELPVFPFRKRFNSVCLIINVYWLERIQR